MNIDSKAQIETWEQKDAAWQPVAHLPFDQAVRERIRLANESAEELGLGHLIVRVPLPTKVAS